MFTDMAGSTHLAQTDEKGGLELLREQERLARPLLATHHGRLVKTTGDGMLVEFANALDAIECAVDLQRHVHERNAGEGVHPIRLRIGIHLGDVQRRGTDIHGDAVNVASRVEPLADPGGVCLSRAVYDQIRHKVPFSLERLGPRTLKGVLEPLDIYRVVLPWSGPVAGTVSGAPFSPRLAVLPLTNISPDPKDEYFADGLTEELIGALSKVRGLRVIARTSVGQYKSTSKTVSQIGAELDVTSILEGSVRKAGNRLRITLQVIDVATQEHLWANNYDRELDDVFAIQTEIAEKTAGALRLELLGHEKESIQKRPTSNLLAYNLYLKGLHAARQTPTEGLSEAIKLFEASLREDPGFSLPYSHLANLFLLLAGNALPPGEAFPRAAQLVSRALELDPNSADAHTARGNLALQYQQDWKLSEDEFKLALELNPSNATTHFWYAMLLVVVKRFDEASRELDASVELDPLWELPRSWRTLIHVLRGDMTSAISSAQETRDRHPDERWAHLALGTTYARAGRLEEARKEAELSARLTGGPGDEANAILWARLGEFKEARRLLRTWESTPESQYVNKTEIAQLCMVLGEKERALGWLERDYESGDRSLWFSYQFPEFDPIRKDPRFQSLLDRLDLPRDA
jgi:adenylate cyclase